MSFSTASKATLALDDLDLRWTSEEAGVVSGHGSLEVLRVAVGLEGSGVLVAVALL